LTVGISQLGLGDVEVLDVHDEEVARVLRGDVYRHATGEVVPGEVGVQVLEPML
jgi:hypothetical protein